MNRELIVPLVREGRYCSWWNDFMRCYGSLTPSQLTDILQYQYECMYKWYPNIGPVLVFDTNQSKVFFELKWVV